ncbi:HAAS domain-containing protein [Lederbergia citrea]|uniref:HAAS domain-containing protein n=1 Tax=Lederbergia citrea TaxID=2833581 RepID=UPI001BC94337|nr:DUF1129 family protein [Lederbergia citrea]MBS4179046.1 DUF1129 family protein [Lederbergia citrea]
MLSTKSVDFIDNLRLYLITSGKNEGEVKEVTEELRDHLIESEKRGKNIDEIIDGTPEAYMDSFRKEMKTDYTGFMKLMPMYFLGVIAYFIMGPAIRGEFELNIIQVIGFPIVSVIALIIYVVLLRQAGKKQYSTKRFFLTGVVSSSSVTALFLVLLLGSNFFAKPFYQASDTVNWLVVAVCAIIFIAGAIWSKAWFPIWIPALLYTSDILMRFLNLKIETYLIISGTTFLLIFIIMILSVIIKGKSKKSKA